MSKPQTTADLLDPKNDYVFFRIFSEAPDLLIDLVNAVRVDEPPIVEITLLDAHLTPERIQGKRLILDLNAVDEQGWRYNVEIQVRRFPFWAARAMMYLSRMLSAQLQAGKDYHQAQPVIGIHLLDFDLLDTPEDQNQALWCFEMRDAKHCRRLGRIMELNIVELRKADRLGQLPERLSAWIAYFEHWNEDAVMNNLAYPPVEKARAKLRTMSADEQERYWAESRARALSDEITLLNEARKEGDQHARQQTALAMLRDGQLDLATIARYTDLSEAQVQQLAAARGQH